MPHGAGVPEGYIILNRRIQQVRGMAGEGDRIPARRLYVRELTIRNAYTALIGNFPEEAAGKSRLPAGHRASDADDLTGLCREGHIGKEGLVRFEAEGQAGDGKVSGGDLFLDGEVVFMHVGENPLPRDLRLLDGVEEVGRVGGLLRQIPEAGEIGGEGCDVPGRPAGTEDVSAAEEDNDDEADGGNQIVDGLGRIVKYSGADFRLLIAAQGLVVLGRLDGLRPVDAVGDGIRYPVQAPRPHLVPGVLGRVDSAYDVLL